VLRVDEVAEDLTGDAIEVGLDLDARDHLDTVDHRYPLRDVARDHVVVGNRDAREGALFRPLRLFSDSDRAV